MCIVINGSTGIYFVLIYDCLCTYSCHRYRWVVNSAVRKAARAVSSRAASASGMEGGGAAVCKGARPVPRAWAATSAQRTEGGGGVVCKAARPVPGVAATSADCMAGRRWSSAVYRAAQPVPVAQESVNDI
jgi:hypothetical protein